MPDPNRDHDLDDAFKHTQFVPDPAFKEALRGRLNDARKSSSQKTTFSTNGSHRRMFVQTRQRETYAGQMTQPTARLIPAFGALILIGLIAVLIIGVLPDGTFTGNPPVPTTTPTPEPTPSATVGAGDRKSVV